MNIKTYVRSLGVFALLLSLNGATATRSETEVNLLLSADQVRVGETVWAGVHIALVDEWHTYWRYGGEVAQPPEILWTLPAGVTAGDIQWPVPEKYEQNGIVSYVYHPETMLLVPLSVSSGSGSLAIEAEVRWLECLEACVPRNVKVETTLVVGDSSTRSAAADSIEAWRAKVPRVDLTLPLAASWDGEAVDDERFFVAGLEGQEGEQLEDFYPHAFDDFEVMGATSVVPRTGQSDGIKKSVFKYDGEWPAEIAGLALIRSGDSKELVETVLRFEGGEAAGGRSEAGRVEAQTAVSGVGGSMVQMLFFAFIGGFILNFMPCVLPVIALKILGFVKQSDEAPGRVKLLGLMYGVGVIVSFLLMAGLVIGVQQAGRLASWGMQFQSLQFLIPMMILVTLVSLNFFGVFEISLGGGAIGAASRVSGREGVGGAFFNGALATILATPCTAPFLAPALGFALAQPPLTIVVFFVTIALGLAFPYVLLSWNPKLLKYMPKPGPWMGRFKTAMGFPMLGTAVWLYSVALSHFGSGAELWLGLLLVFVALAAWIWGQFVQQVPVRRPLSIGLALLIGFGGTWWILERELHWRQAAPMARTDDGQSEGELKNGILWKPWSHAAVAEARQAGHPVLIDFTAKWCQNCQFNKRSSIEIDAVREKIKSVDAVTFKADFTHYDPEIAGELRRFDRAGVPLVLVYSPDESQEVNVLPPLLTPSIVLEALDLAGNPN